MTQEEYYRNYNKFDKLPHHEQVSSLNAFIEKDRKHWDDIYINGCSDPFWPDGTNLNLVRNHIIHWLIKLAEIDRTDRQISIFDLLDGAGYSDWQTDKRLPPKVSNDYMAKNRKVFGTLMKTNK